MEGFDLRGTAWRAPKVEKLLRILQEFNWDAIVPMEETEEEEVFLK